MVDSAVELVPVKLPVLGGMLSQEDVDDAVAVNQAHDPLKVFPRDVLGGELQKLRVRRGKQAFGFEVAHKAPAGLVGSMQDNPGRNLAEDGDLGQKLSGLDQNLVPGGHLADIEFVHRLAGPGPGIEEPGRRARSIHILIAGELGNSGQKPLPGFLIHGAGDMGMLDDGAGLLQKCRAELADIDRLAKLDGHFLIVDLDRCRPTVAGLVETTHAVGPGRHLFNEINEPKLHAADGLAAQGRILLAVGRGLLLGDDVVTDIVHADEVAQIIHRLGADVLLVEAPVLAAQIGPGNGHQLAVNVVDDLRQKVDGICKGRILVELGGNITSRSRNCPKLLDD